MVYVGYDDLYFGLFLTNTVFGEFLDPSFG